jgi:hypothetical protein
VYNDHPWDLKKVAVLKKGLIKVRIRLVLNESNRSLLSCGQCSEVVVKAGLTVVLILMCTSCLKKHQNMHFKICFLCTYMGLNLNVLDFYLLEMRQGLPSEEEWPATLLDLRFCGIEMSSPILNLKQLQTEQICYTTYNKNTTDIWKTT